MVVDEVSTNELNRFLIAATSLATAVFDDELKIVRCNDLFNQLLGSGSSLAGLPLTQIARSERSLEITRDKLLTNSPLRMIMTLNVGHEHSLLCHFLVAADGLLLIGEQPVLSSGEIMEELSKVNNDLVNLTRSLQKKNAELERAKEKIKTLSGLVPICAHCKSIRDDGGYWSMLETYIQKHSDATFSHGICPKCAKEIYPEHYQFMFPDE